MTNLLLHIHTHPTGSVCLEDADKRNDFPLTKTLFLTKRLRQAPLSPLLDEASALAYKNCRLVAETILPTSAH